MSKSIMLLCVIPMWMVAGCVTTCPIHTIKNNQTLILGTIQWLAEHEIEARCPITDSIVSVSGQ